MQPRPPPPPSPAPLSLPPPPLPRLGTPTMWWGGTVLSGCCLKNCRFHTLSHTQRCMCIHIRTHTHVHTHNWLLLQEALVSHSLTRIYTRIYTHTHTHCINPNCIICIGRRSTFGRFVNFRRLDENLSPTTQHFKDLF